MDNIAHTLVGAALGRAVADHKIPRAAFLGAIAANAPDFTEVFVGLPADGPAYLVLHRGVTHALAGLAVQIVALTALVAGAWAWRARRRRGAPPPWPWIASCVAAAVLSHSYMDWQGSYGLRPFLPWSARWYYGDFVAIVDPFFWLVPLIALAWGERRDWRAALPVAGAWVGIALLLLVLYARLVAPWVRVAVVGLAALCVAGWIRHWLGVAERRRAAAWGLLALGAYAAAQEVASMPVKVTVRDDARTRFGATAQWAALTRPGHPFTWQPIYASADSVAGVDWVLPRGLDRPEVRRALRTPEGRAIAGFARFLFAEVDSTGGRVTVYLRDARFAPAGRGDWPVVAVPTN